MQGIAAQLGGRWLETSRGGYTVTMREDEGTDEVLARLGAEAPGAGRLHVGWGSFRNLDLVAARRSDAVLLLDVNRHQRVVWECVRGALETSTTAAAFVERLARTLPREPPPRRFGDSLVAWLQADLTRASSWLSERAPDRYAFVRSRFAEGCVGVACLDVREASRAATVLSRAGADGGERADTLYLSTLPWMVRQPADLFGRPQAPGGLERLWREVEGLCSPRTWVVRAEAPAAANRPDDLRWRTEAQLIGEARRLSLALPGPEPS